MFENVILLGFYCEVAKELERIGLRSASYPFDWLISSWSGVEKMIDNNFDGFLNYDDLQQYENSREKYCNKSLGFHFFHDFDKFTSLENQMAEVEDKYKRRVQRFYNDIKRPTLFIRYVQSLEEVEFWKNNYNIVSEKLKSHNLQNAIWLINCFDSDFKNENVFYVEPDENDYICRYFFLEKIPELQNRLVSDEYFSKEARKENLKRFEAKQKEKNSLKSKIKKKYNEKKEERIPEDRYYKHNKIYDA